MGYHRRALFAAISLLCMLVTRPATVQSVSHGAPRSLIVHGGKISRSLHPSSACTIINGVKICNPPPVGHGSPQSRQPQASVRRKP
ncbi:hypothetical protein MUK42_36657 [Musa troglodytarum]|uniref:Secreted protein n=1 Tax=Musa troglodytarum TaxID=320322 RepID=A0A9E7FP36_9LILI|nr:hypothetical protein MUK42_36657 [Musa troglodytarum]